ncbi:hypothetical protein DL93DRAFT_1498386 [Clavulina sp. PMI_390]|nr:hypothetical protein DL93DRAFT_1498386 [Clavulina sp. PMI_390]
MAFSAFQIVATRNFRVEFLRITRDGACNGVNLLPNYWEDRQDIETAQLVLNVVAFIVSVWLSWKLIKQFGWQTFKRVGANMGVNRMYKLVLGLSVVLQLSIFFVVASVALWVEQICIGAASFIVHHKIFYEVTYLIVLIFLFPWAACGWFGVRRESKLMTHIFIGGTILLLGSWAAMFASSTFRLLVQSWKFFATLTIISIILLCCVLVLTVACRLQFGKHAKKLTNYRAYLVNFGSFIAHLFSSFLFYWSSK